MKRIYNRKGFKLGIFYLLLSFLSTWLLIVRCNDLDTMKLIKDIIIMLITYGLGSTCLVRSLSAKWSEEDAREEQDERNKLVTLKAQSTAFKISFNSCLVFELLIVLLYVKTKIEGLLYGFIAVGLLSSLMLITVIGVSIYYEEKH